VSRRLAWALAGVAGALGVAGPAVAGGWPPPGVTLLDRVEAIVNREPITRFELERAMRPYEAKLRSDAERAGRDVNEDRKRLRQEILNSLVNDILIRDEARKMHLEVDPEQVDAQLTRVKQANGWDDDQLAQAVRQLGFESIADYRAHARKEILKNQVISIRVAAKVKIDESEVERLYAEEYGQDEGVEERRAAHILLRLPEFATDEQVAQAVAKLRALKARVAQGETFEELARAYSDDNNRAAGGDLGWFSKGELDPDFEKAAFALKEGEVSEPVRSSFGVHLIKLTGVRRQTNVDAEKAASLKRQIRYRLRERELERLYKKWVESLRSQAFVEIKPPVSS